MLTSPNHAAVVGRHGDVGHALQTDAGCPRIDGFQIADTHVRCLRLETCVERGVAVGAECAADVEWSVHDQRCIICEHLVESGKQPFDFRPTHDVQRVGAEYGIVVRCRPRVLGDIQLQGRWRVGEHRIGEPRANAWQVLRAIRTLPEEMRHGLGEENRMLRRSAADFEHVAPIGELRTQHRQNRFAIT